MIIPTARTSIAPVSIPSLRTLVIARFSVDGSPEVELVAPVAAMTAVVEQTAASVARTVRPARKAR